MERDAETASPPIKLTIVRSRWARGGINGPSRMLNDHGNLCCLGFLGRACGYPDYLLQRRPDPVSVVRAQLHTQCSFPKGLLTDGDCLTDIGHSLVNANDNPTLAEDVREEHIASLMTEIGVEVTFVD